MPFRTGHDKKSVPVHPPLYHTPATEPEPSALHTAHPNYVYPPDPLAPLAPPQWESSSGDARLAQLYPYGIYHDAGRDNFERGVRFCEIHPWVNFARLVCNEDLEKVRTHSIGAWTLTKPSQFTGEVTRNRNGTIEVKTSFSPSVDKTLVSSLPVLFGLYSPRQGAKGVYFEVEIQRLRKDAVVAVGFGCLPYPTDFRLPGWHRHSAAVHSDDGFKFFENPDGGVPFSNPLHEGGTFAVPYKLLTKRCSWGWNLSSYSEFCGEHLLYHKWTAGSYRCVFWCIFSSREF